MAEKSYIDSLAELSSQSSHLGSNTMFLYYLGDRRYYGKIRPPYSYYLGFLKNMDLMSLDIINKDGPRCTIIHSSYEDLRRDMLNSLVAQMLIAHEPDAIRLHLLEPSVGLQVFQDTRLVKSCLHPINNSGQEFLDRSAELLERLARQSTVSPPIDVVVTDNLSILLMDRRCRRFIEMILDQKNLYGVRIIATDDPSLGMVDSSIVDRSNNVLLKMSPEASRRLFGSDGFSSFDSTKAALLIPGSGNVKVVTQLGSIRAELPSIIKGSLRDDVIHQQDDDNSVEGQ